MKDGDFLSTCSRSNFVKIHAPFEEKKSKMFQPIRGQGSHLYCWCRKLNTYNVLHMKFCQTLFISTTYTKVEKS